MRQQHQRVYFIFSILLIFNVIFGFTSCTSSDSNELTVRSPDGKLELSFNTGIKDLSYRVDREDFPVIRDSKLGFLLAGQPAMNYGFEVKTLPL